MEVREEVGMGYHEQYVGAKRFIVAADWCDAVQQNVYAKQCDYGTHNMSEIQCKRHFQHIMRPPDLHENCRSDLDLNSPPAR